MSKPVAKKTAKKVTKKKVAEVGNPSVLKRNQLFGTPELKFKKLDPTAVLPEYKSEGAAGMDVCACVRFPVRVESGSVALIPTGLAAAVPEGYEMQVRPRSGLAVKKGLTVVNAPGTIDSDYRGEVKVGLVNLGDSAVEITSGMRIAQLVVAPVVQVSVEEVEELDETERGEGGFGSTGEK